MGGALARVSKRRAIARRHTTTTPVRSKCLEEKRRRGAPDEVSAEAAGRPITKWGAYAARHRRRHITIRSANPARTKLDGSGMLMLATAASWICANDSTSS